MKSKKVSFKSENKFLRIFILEPMNMDNGSIIENKIILKIDSIKQDTILLDFSKIEMLFSSCMGAIIRIDRYAKEAGKRVFLVNTTDKIYNGFIDVGLDKIMNIYKDEKELKL